MMGYPINTRPRPSPQDKSQDDKAKLLTGMNGNLPEKLAITRGDVAQLGQIKLLSAKVSSAPTVDDHNAIVDDIRAIATVLNAMGAKFTGL